MERALEVFRQEIRGLTVAGPQSTGPRSRGSRYHGRLFWNLRNELFDAIPHEIRQRGGTSKNPLRRNQFGFNISGPVMAPLVFRGARSTFFSFSYEGVREGVGRSYLRTVAIPAEREGDFSKTVDAAGDPLLVYDPASTRLNPAFDASRPVSTENLQYIREPFPENRIPAVRLDPVAVAALQFYPQPNADAGPFFQNNYFSVSKERNEADGIILKLDHSVSEQNRFAFGYSYSSGLEASAPVIPGPADSSPPDREYLTHNTSLEHVYTFSPQSIHTISFEFDRTVTNNTSPNGGYPAALGLQGVAAEVFPRFHLRSYVPMGRIAPVRVNVRNTFELGNSLSLRSGKHTLELSGRLERTQLNVLSPQYPAGSFRFGEGLTSLPGIINTGHAFASFLLGMAESAELSLHPNPSYWRNTRLFLTVRERYDAHPGLSLQAGINLDGVTPRVEKFNRQSTVDLNATDPESGRRGILVFAGRNGRGSAFQPFRLHIEPSLSLAWSPRGNPKNVVRASYWLNYSPPFLRASQWGTQGFNGYQTLSSTNEQLAPALLLKDGVPEPTRRLPDLRTDAADGAFADYIEPTGRDPMFQELTLTLERQLPFQLVVSAGVGHRRGKNMGIDDWVLDLNAVPLEALAFRDRLNDLTFRQSLKPYPQFLGFNLGEQYPGGRYQRSFVHLRLEKRLTSGLSLNTVYAYARHFDDYSSGRQDFFNPRNEWSLNAWQGPHELSFSYLYELPIGPNKPWLRLTGWPRHMVEGWSVSGMSSVEGGTPLMIRPKFNNTGGVVPNLRVNVRPGANPHVPNPSPELWFNPDAFLHPEDFTIGNASRTHPTLRGPIRQNHDLSVRKRVAVTQEQSLEFTASAFNFLNHANWRDPDTEIGTPEAPNLNAGRIIGSRGGRVIQLGMRFSF